MVVALQVSDGLALERENETVDDLVEFAVVKQRHVATQFVG